MEDEMGGEFSMHGRDDKYLQKSGRKAETGIISKT
jgi:hypothetical protein